MNLCSSEVKINQEKPFENDLFNRENACKKISEDLKNLEGSLVLALNGRWGEGKTTFVKMLEALLKKQGASCVYFDAFKNDINDDAFLALASEFYNAIEINVDNEKATKGIDIDIEKIKEKVKKNRGDFLEKATSIASRLCTFGLKKTIQTVLPIDIDKEEIEKIKDLLTASPKGDIKNIISNSHQREEDLDTLKKTISSIAEQIKRQTKFPLIFIIDELDRCRPTYALEILERIKHIFLTDNICFILVMNKDQMLNSIKHLYGTEIEADTYLQKFIDLEFTLPSPSNNKPPLKSFIENLQFSTDEKIDREIKNTIIHCSQIIKLTARDVQKISNITKMYFNIVPEKSLARELATIVALLACLKLIHNDELTKFMNKEITLEDFWKSVNLDKIFNSCSVKIQTEFPISKEFTFTIFKAWASPESLSAEEGEGLRHYLFRYNIHSNNILGYLVRMFDFYD